MKSSALIFLLILTLGGGPLANPQITTFHLQNTEGDWYLKASVNRSQMDKAMKQYYKGRNLDPVFINEYKSHIASYTLSHMTILNVDGLEISPMDCEVKMNANQVDLQMQLSEAGFASSDLIISLNFMSEIANHQNRLIIKEDENMNEVILSSENNYTMIGGLVQNEGSTFFGLRLVTWLWILIPAALVVFLMTFGFNIYENHLSKRSEFS